MPRKLKPQKVDTVQGRHGISVDVMLDRNQLDFFARLDREEVRAPSAEECKARALTMIANWRAPEWKGVIRVWVQGGNTRCGGYPERRGRYPERRGRLDERMGLCFERFERAKSPSGGDIWRPHVREVEERQNDLRELGVEGVHPYTRRRETGDDVSDHLGSLDDGEVEVPYSDELWDALKMAQEPIARLRLQLGRLINSDTFVSKMVEAAATGRLPLLQASDNDHPQEEE